MTTVSSSRHLFIDPAGGVAGDMLLALLLGLSPDRTAALDHLRAAFGPLFADLQLDVVDERRGGFAGVRLVLEVPGAQPLRHLPDLLALLERIEPLSDTARTRCAAAFTRLAEAEAAVHGMDVSRVHFHEVGAVDTLIDIAGAFLLLERLGIERMVSAPLPWFRGEVQCEHGTLALPAPAVRHLLAGAPVRPSDVQGEIVTPTGALVLTEVVDAWASGPDGTVLATATAFGTREVPGAQCGLRGVLYESRR